MGSDTVATALRDAVDDRDVKAILFRVDSPGGSYVASDTIWRETVRAREAGKPVIVSMGNLAGSGGYFVAIDATKIVAQPGTITASIGVLGGKMLTAGMWDWLGIDWDEVHTSDQSTLWTGTKDYNPAEWASFQAWLDRVYADFTGKVAKGRKLPIERVREIAKGRIWSGEDGKKIGLVDELGGFPVALRLAREAAGLSVDEPINLKLFPPKASTWERFWSQEPDSSESKAFVSLLGSLQPAARGARQVMFPRRPAGVLSMPIVEPAM
jgi:protease IV